MDIPQLFSPDDVDLIREMLAFYRSQQGETVNPRLRAALTGQRPQVVGVYAALTPVGGIPGMLESPPGTGTGTQTGEDGDRPGSAECRVFRLLPVVYGGTTYMEMKPTGFSITVYNMNYTAVDPLQFITPVKDPYGTWWVSSQGLRFGDC